MSIRERLIELLGGELPTDDDSQDEFDCAANRHEVFAVMVSTSRDPVGYRCKNCGARCDAHGKALT